MFYQLVRRRIFIITLSVVTMLSLLLASMFAQGLSVAHADSPTTHVVLLLGQSNMAGRGEDYNSTFDPGDPRIQQYTAAGVLKAASEPLGHPDAKSAGGPGLAFAREYLQTLPAGDKILLIPASYGGTGFRTPDSNGKNMSWDVGRPNTSDNLYERSLTQLQNAINAVSGTGPVQIDAALLNVGGTDALNHVTGPEYQAYLDAFIGGYRSRLSLPGLPFVLGPSRPDAIATNSWYRGINTVQIATPARVASTAYIPGAVGTEFYKTTDTVHFNQIGNRAMGLQYAHALAGILNGLPTLTIPSNVSLNQPAQMTTLDIKWNGVSGATGYKVEYKQTSASTWTVFGTTAALRVQPTALQQATSYDFRIRATDGSNNLSEPSASFTVSTASTLPPPQSELYLGVVGVAADRATGLRKLSASYTGADIVVRRSLDNAEQTIGFSGENLDTASLLSFAGTGSAYVKTWYDQSGNGRHLTQAAASRQAQIVNNGVLVQMNNKPAVNFDGIDDYYSDTNVGLYTGGSATLSIVMKAPTTTATAHVINESNSTTSNGTHSYRMLRSSVDKLNFQIYNNASSVYAASSGALFNNTGHNAYTIDSGSRITSYLDGTLGLNAAYARTGTLTPNNFTVGATVQTTIYGYYAGTINEFITWKVALTDAQRQAGQANQKNYYVTP